MKWTTKSGLALLLGCLALASSGPALRPPAPPVRPPGPGRHLSRQQALTDLAFFQRVQEQANAGLYSYRPKAVLDSAFAAARAQVADSVTVLDMHRLVAGLTDLAGSLHSDTALPDSVWQARQRQRAFFPWPVKVLGGALLLDHARAGLPLGTEILAVNGVPAAQLLRVLGRYYTTDGFNQTGKQAGVSEYFAKYFYFTYGPAATFAVTCRLPGGAASQTRQLAAGDYATVVQRTRQRHSATLDSAAAPAGGRLYGFRLVGPVAVLTLRSFDLDGGAPHRAYRRFLDSCFALVRARPGIGSVLVDVRGNGGGTDPNDLLTFSYLARRPFRENRAACVASRTLPELEYLLTEHPAGRPRRREISQLTRELRREFALPAGPGRYCPQRARYNPWHQPSPLATGKPVGLLIDGRVASAASLFAALVRGNTPAVVVGEETMGGYYGHTGHTPVAYRLPHSGIVVQFSLVDLAQDVPPRPDQPPGRGVLPDYPARQSAADFVAGRDTPLELALKLLAAVPRPATPPGR